ncbi:MAG: hypothetical protein ACOX56_02365 [Acholeplasmataceae bacterium]|jgi:energy-coupling factor transport system substrate-specific component
MKNSEKTKRLVTISILTAILFVQEQILTPIPNVQLTFLLIILYCKTFNYVESVLMITVHVILDNLLMGSFNLTVMPFMYLGYLVIPITLKTIFKKVESPLGLAILSILYSLIYSWIFFIPAILILEIPFWTYLIQDIPFEIILAASSFLSVLWLYRPLKRVLDSHLGSKPIINDESGE